MGGFLPKQFSWNLDDDDDDDVIDELEELRRQRDKERKEQLEREQTEQLEAALNDSALSHEDDSDKENNSEEDRDATSEDETGDVSDVCNEDSEEEESDDEDEESREQNEGYDEDSDTQSERTLPERVEKEKPAVEQKPLHRPVSRPLARKSKSESTVGRSRGDVVQIRDFPASIATHIQNLFHGKPAMGKALAAYILAVSDIDLSGAEDIPDDIRELSREMKSGRKNASVNDLYTRLASIDSHNMKTNDMLQALEVAVAYIIFDRHGFRRVNAAEPKDIDILEGDMMDLVDRIRQQGKLSKNEDLKRHGRAIR